MDGSIGLKPFHVAPPPVCFAIPHRQGCCYTESINPSPPWLKALWQLHRCRCVLERTNRPVHAVSQGWSVNGLPAGDHLTTWPFAKIEGKHTKSALISPW